MAARPNSRPRLPPWGLSTALPVLLLATMILIGLGIEAVAYPPVRLAVKLPVLALIAVYFLRRFRSPGR